jgi:hypothetical protein
MKMFTCTCAQDEVTHQRLRVGSKKTNIGSPPARRVTRLPVARPQPILRAEVYAEYVSTENGDLPARLRVEALQRVDVKPLSAFVATSAKEARRRQGTPLAAFFNRPFISSCGKHV